MRSKIVYGSFISICLFIGTKASGTQIHIPGDQPTIQQGIDASASGDTVVVAPGEYFENINLHGKNILLTSNYYLTDNFEDISNTIINGSMPTVPDTASVILIISGETNQCIIQGFTITGGSGTKWLDEHGAGTYREGGGFLIQYASPVIRYNYIINNHVTNNTGVASTGGGGMRCGDSNPLIMNNIIMNNEGVGYGGGLVFNYCDHAVVQNNLIANNIGGDDYSGGGIWATGSSPSQIVECINNTIVNNTATGAGGYAGKGGGVFIFTVSLNIINCIFRGNDQSTGGPIYSSGGIITTTYSDVEGGYIGTGNIDLDPIFTDTVMCFITDPISPCVDAGAPSTDFYDAEDTGDPGNALYPSFGTTRNDIGMYGGPEAKMISVCDTPATAIASIFNQNNRIYPNPADDTIVLDVNANATTYFLDLAGNKIAEIKGNSVLNIHDWPAAIYIYQIMVNNEMISSGKLVVE